MEHPAPFVTMNSIIGDSGYGDERDFAMASVLGTKTDKNGRPLALASEKGSEAIWSNDIAVEDSQRYVIRLFVHNNAASNLNLIAENVSAKVFLPRESGFSTKVEGTVSLDNGSPSVVYDGVSFQGSEPFWLEYIKGSALYITNAVPDGMPVPDSVSGNGALLGYDALDGRIPGCAKYSGWLTLMVMAHAGVFPAEAIKGVEAEFAVNQRFYRVNGHEFYSVAEPYLSAGRTMVPLRLASEALGFRVYWDDAAKTASVENGGKIVNIPLNQDLPDSLGKAEISNGIVYVPLRFLSLQLEADIDWDDYAKTAKASKIS
jgi:hypothetical protein